METAFSERQWELMKLLPFQFFAIVAGADGEIDTKEILAFQSQFSSADKLENALHKDLLVDAQNEDISRYISNSVNATRFAYNARSIVPMLKGKLDEEAYEDFIVSLFKNAVDIARASGGGLFKSAISKEESKALSTIADMFDIAEDRFEEAIK